MEPFNPALSYSQLTWSWRAEAVGQAGEPWVGTAAGCPARAVRGRPSTRTSPTSSGCSPRADRFPELGRTYYERGPERVHALLAESFGRLADRKLLTLDDPVLAANHLTWLITSIPVNKGMFCGSGEHFTRAEPDHCADEAVRVFLAAYRPDTQSA